MLKRSRKSKSGQYPLAFKVKAIKRVERGEAPTGEARGALAAAQRRIAELERVIGRQQLELDFFQQALHALDGKATQGKRGPVLPKSSKR